MMTPDALVHLRIPAATKGRWIRASRAAGLRLTDWIMLAVDEYMRQQITHISVPDDLNFSELRLAREPNGDVGFDWHVIERICAANNLPVEIFRDAPEQNVTTLLVAWYQMHRQHGGAPDPVADDLIAETDAENAAGQSFSYPPART